MARKRIDADALEVLRDGLSIKGTHVTITSKLDAKLYKKMKDVFLALGGPWNKKAGAHVFAEDPTEAIAATVETGEYVSPTEARKLFGFVPTPRTLAERMADLAGLFHNARVLEPSGGRGALVDVVRRRAGVMGLHGVSVLSVELMEDNHKALAALPVKLDALYRDDFLKIIPAMLGQPRAHVIIGNPPFLAGADVKHILHAWDEWLEPGGRLVMIASGGVQFRETKAHQRLRELAEEYGSIEELPRDTFAESKVEVASVLVTLDKPGPSKAPGDSSGWKLYPEVAAAPVPQAVAKGERAPCSRWRCDGCRWEGTATEKRDTGEAFACPKCEGTAFALLNPVTGEVVPDEAMIHPVITWLCACGWNGPRDHMATKNNLFTCPRCDLSSNGTWMHPDAAKLAPSAPKAKPAQVLAPSPAKPPPPPEGQQLALRW